MANILITPEELMQEANQMVQKSVDLSSLLQSLDGKIETIAAAWDGLAQNAFYNTYQGMREQIQAFPEAVQGIGIQAQAAAKAFDETDSALAQAFSG